MAGSNRSSRPGCSGSNPELPRLRGAACLLAALALIVLWSAGCQHTDARAAGPPQAGGSAAPLAAAAPAQAGQAASAAQAPSFDASQAFQLLRDQVAFGPRYLGSEAHVRMLKWLIGQMQPFANETVLQKFSYRGMPVVNVVGVIYAAGQKKPSPDPVLLMAHWDTRPIADGPYSSETKQGPFVYGPNGWNRLAPIPGATDGASGVAVLLELARMFHAHPPPVGVLLLADDGEDYGDFTANNYKGEGVELGSRYYASHYQDNAAFGKPRWGILLDMVGGKSLTILPEKNSETFDPELNDRVFSVARSLGYGTIFLPSPEQDVDDDHIAINVTGHIPMIDLIQPLPGAGMDQYAYKQWHTLQDDVAHCDPASLKAVGETVAQVIYSEQP